MEGHQTRIKRKHGLRVVSCSCGWSQEAVSNYGAWLAVRRHLDGRPRPPARDWTLLQAETERSFRPGLSLDAGPSMALQVAPARRPRRRRGETTG